MRRLYLLLLGVFVLFISLTTVSYAYTLDDVFLYASQLTDITINNAGGSNYNNAYSVCYNLLSSKETQVRNMFNQYYSTADNFGVNYFYNNTGIGVRIMCYKGDNTYCGHANNTTSDGVYERCWVSGGTFLGSIYVYSSVNGSNSNVERQPSSKSDIYSNSSLNNSMPKGFYLVKTGDYSGTGFSKFCINGIQSPSQYYFVSYYTNEIYFNEISGFCYRLPFSYNETYKKIGYIEGWEDLDRIHGNLSSPYNISGEEIHSNTIGAFQYNKNDGSLSKNLILNELTGDIYINTSCLYNKQAYIVSLSGMIGDDYIYIPLVDTELDPSYYAYFYTANVSNSGDNSIISNDYYQTLPPSLINFINNNDTTYDDVQKNNIDYYLNQFFNGLSGDFVSGDIIGQLGYIDHSDNDFSLYIYTIYRNILDILVSSNTDSTLTFTLRGNTYTFNASDFAIPDGPLKSFVSLILTGGLLYLFYIQIHYYILNITTLDLFKALKGFEHEHTFYM